MTQAIRKAIFPIAGLGTRLLPATKSIPKEILTLVDRPLIQYAIDEARTAGIEDFIFVTSKGKSALEDYFDHDAELEFMLRRRHKDQLADDLLANEMDSGAIAYVRQNVPLGLGHAVWCARKLVGDEPFAVILTDDVIIADPPCLSQLMDAQMQTGGCMIALMEVAPELATSYGLAKIGRRDGALVSLAGLVEKPEAAQVPSNLAVIGRYLLTGDIMRTLGSIKPGIGGEIQLTDAISQQIEDNHPVHGFLFDGRRFDCGGRAGLLQATVSLALERPDLEPDFRAFLEDLCVRRSSQQ